MINSLPRPVRFALLILYYFASLLVVFGLYSAGAFATPTFIYQGF